MNPTPDGRRIFIGDVHGCAAELDDLLQALAPAADDELWFVGDLVNRGPDSLGALRKVRQVAAGAVLGNHDLHLLGVAAGDRKPRDGDTLKAILKASDRKGLLRWLRERPLVVEWPDLVLVHAGLHPAWEDFRGVARPREMAISVKRIPWKDPVLSLFTRVRHCDEFGRLPKDDDHPGNGFAPWDTFYKGSRPVVCGHWAARGLLMTERLRSLDTGCVWGGRLTAWIAEEDRVVSVPARKQYLKPRACRGPDAGRPQENGGTRRGVQR